MEFEPEEEPTKLARYSVPENIDPNGFYAIQISQAEMYDLGNIDFISHFIIYDRKQKIAIDVTSDVKPAPLLSATNPAGVKYFIAVELEDPCYIQMREKMVE